MFTSCRQRRILIRSAKSIHRHSQFSGGDQVAMQVQVRDTALAINSNDSILREYFAEEHDRRLQLALTTNPHSVRDTALAINSNDSIPKSDVNREYFAEEHDRRSLLPGYIKVGLAFLSEMLSQCHAGVISWCIWVFLFLWSLLIQMIILQARVGIDYESSYDKACPNDTILKLQRTTPYYKRNIAHVCSLYVRGECTRGVECPYRHEMPIIGELSQQISRIVSM
ncbi:hypothetical protein IFM89_021537, partial [Coptis chinensis]